MQFRGSRSSVSGSAYDSGYGASGYGGGEYGREGTRFSSGGEAHSSRAGGGFGGTGGGGQFRSSTGQSFRPGHEGYDEEADLAAAIFESSLGVAGAGAGEGGGSGQIGAATRGTGNVSSTPGKR